MARRRRLAEQRKAQGLTQGELAEILNIDKGTPSRWEQYFSTPQPGHRPALAKALDVDTATLDDLLVPDDEAGPSHPVSPVVVADWDRQTARRLASATGALVATTWTPPGFTAGHAV